MKTQKTKKTIACLLLFVYLLFLYKTFIVDVPTNSETQFTIFYLYSEYLKHHAFSDLLFEYLRKIVYMIPFGILYSFAKQRECFSKTLTYGSCVGFLFEILQLIFHKEHSCFDDVLLATLGSYVGYLIILLLCKNTFHGFLYLYPRESRKRTGFLKSLTLFLFLFFILNGIMMSNIPFALHNIAPVQSDLSYHDMIYQIFYSEIADHKTSVTIPVSVNSDEISNQFQNVLYDHPEFFWPTGGGSIMQLSTSAATGYIYSLNVNGDMSEIPTMQSLLNDTVKKIVNAANQYENDYEKALFVHDYIIKNCEYDEDTFYSLSVTNDIPDKNYSATSYGCLVDHKAICSGYAKAYQLIMNELNIECGFVSGTATNELANNGNHAWNYIKLDDGYYLVDVTWDDPIGSSSDEIRRDYFCLTTAEFSIDHTPDSDQDVPVCNGTRY